MRMDVPGKGPIEFEGRLLPEAAKHFDEAPFFAELSDEVQNWILDLRYAWGRERESPSEVVLSVCDELEKRIASQRVGFIGRVRAFLGRANSVNRSGEWLRAIAMMRECAMSTETCTWTVEPQDGEVEYFLNQTLMMMRFMEKKQNTTIVPPEFLESITAATSQKQIDFILKISDGFGRG